MRAARHTIAGIYVFYVPSRSRKDVEHTVHFVRRAKVRYEHCTCESHTFVRMPLGTVCDHIKALRLLAKEYHGIKKLHKAVIA